MANLWEPVCGVYSSTASVLPCLGWLTELGNSSFFTTVFGALAGAFTGAWAAQRIAVRSRRQEELIKEIRSTNSAMLLGQAILNISISSKIECALPLKEAFDEAYRSFKQNTDNTKALNLNKYTCVSMPIDALSSLMLTEISASSEAFRAFLYVQISINSYITTLARRNELVDIFRSEIGPSHPEFHTIYFGETHNGITNKAYRDSIEQIYDQCDDLIFYSNKMCLYLGEHAIHLKGEYEKLAKSKVAVARIELKSVKPGLIPSDESYAHWLAAHRPFKKSAQVRWWHFRTK